jgi:microsomal prostaglandin-E synthase 2
MRFFRKIATSVCIGGGAVVVFQAGRSSSKPKTPPLTSEAFNATQDTALAKKLLNAIVQKKPLDDTKSAPKLVLFRLLGCPYCARVKAVLDYFHAEYDEVLIDPITGSGFRDERYPFVPQLMMSDGAGEGPLIVDSEEILRTLAAVFHFERDLQDMRVGQTRQWMIDRYQRVTFVALSASWWSSFQLYPQVVPSWWNYFPARVVGATALYGLSRFKIQPKLTGSASLEDVRSPQWLVKETNYFFDQFKTKSDQFHGGKKPDLADIEMLGVLRSVLDHAETGEILRGDLRIAAWLDDMAAA